MEIYLQVLRDWNKFSGRASRTEFWTFVLVNALVNCALWLLGTLIGPIVFISYLYSLAILVPTLAVGMRRLHDAGKEGLWIIGSFVPLLNLVVLYFLILESEPGSNQHGPNPTGA